MTRLLKIPLRLQIQIRSAGFLHTTQRFLPTTCPLRNRNLKILCRPFRHSRRHLRSKRKYDVRSSHLSLIALLRIDDRSRRHQLPHGGNSFLSPRRPNLKNQSIMVQAQLAKHRHFAVLRVISCLETTPHQPRMNHQLLEQVAALQIHGLQQNVQLFFYLVRRRHPIQTMQIQAVRRLHHSHPHPPVASAAEDRPSLLLWATWQAAWLSKSGTGYWKWE